MRECDFLSHVRTTLITYGCCSQIAVKGVQRRNGERQVMLRPSRERLVCLSLCLCFEMSFRISYVLGLDLMQIC